MPTRIAGLGAAAACLTVVAGLSATSPAGATAPRGAASGPTSVTVVLAAPDAAALETLSRQTSLGAKERRARAEALDPSDATVSSVVAGLEAHGLTVTGTTSWTVTATAPAATISSLFGSPPAANDPLPKTPGFLGGDAAVVVPGGGSPVFTHHLTNALDGGDFRNAYTAAGTTPASGAAAAASTIATVQFADWDSSELQTYATHAGITLGSGQYTAIDVSDGTDTGSPTDADGSGEVALDQESILATSPYARQRAYFAPNTDAGFINLLGQVDDDAAAHNIVALSSSWGACETYFAGETLQAMEPVLASLAAKGVTTFSASGDAGVYDCPGGSVGVDYPASSPSVVGVGGTSLTRTGASSANTGSNWSETAWSCLSYTACDANGGTGGGASVKFAQPPWQRATVPASYRTGARLVPDIAADADPHTGFTIYHPDDAYADPDGYVTYGGTSLAAPVSAALLTNALAAAGRTGGAGDIHAALYTAYDDTWCRSATSPSTVVRDVKTGSNGSNADTTILNPSTKTAAGYDTVTGVGGVLWNALVPYLSGTPAGATSCSAVAAPAAPAPVPSATISVLKPKKHTHPSKRSVVATWSVANASARGETVTVYDATAKKTLGTSGAPVGSLTFKVKLKHTVTITVTAYDASGAPHVVSASAKTPKR